MAVAQGTKIELADMQTLGALAQTKAGVGIPGGYHFIGKTITVDHATESPTVAGWLNLDYLDRAGLLIGDVVINTRFPNATQAVKGWRLTGYPWNDPTKWVNAQYRVGTTSQMFATAPTNGVRFWATDTRELYIRRSNTWELFHGWATELLKIQTALKTHSRFNLLDPARTATFQGYSRTAIVSDRGLCAVSWISSGPRVRDYGTAEPIDAFEPRYTPAVETGGGADFSLDNTANTVGDSALQRELLHFGGNGATWKMDMIPQLSHVGGLSGFRLAGEGCYVRGRLSNMPLGIDGFPNWPGQNAVLWVGSGSRPPVFSSITLQGSMASISTYHTATATDPGNFNRIKTEFHIYINGVMPPGDCTIGATITLGAGWVWENNLSPFYLPMAGVTNGGVVYPVWVEAGIGNVSQPLVPSVSSSGR
jgi:hypothetical protein